MKFVSAIFKILAALAFVAGAIYLLATYGDKIVAWAKKMIPCEQFKCCSPEAEEAEEAAEEVSEEVVEIPVEETPVAEDADFVG